LQRHADLPSGKSALRGLCGRNSGLAACIAASKFAVSVLPTAIARHLCAQRQNQYCALLD
jgi:hypothetical protein